MTDKPAALLAAFDARIHQEEPKGKITTWEKHRDGVHYTHKSTEWHQKAYFKPNVLTDQLVFNIIAPQGGSIETVVYGYYHGHLTETFLNHFDKMFTWAQSSALPTKNDILQDTSK